MISNAIVAYDVTCSKRRRRALRCCKVWRLAGQYSVHECQLSERNSAELLTQLIDELAEDEDRLLLAWLDKRRPCLSLGVDDNSARRKGLWWLG